MKLTHIILSATPSLIVASDYRCTDLGGTCQDSRTYTCNGHYETGICDGSSYRKCCIADNDPDYACHALGGECYDSSKVTCQNGDYISGYCSGANSIKCCVENNCPLIKWTSSKVKGYYHDVYVENDFLPCLQAMQDEATANSLTVWVTQAYRKDGVDPINPIVPPSSTSNHLVGHAIDCNLDTPYGWGNGDCMAKAYVDRNYDKYAYDFLHAMTKRGYRYGVFWSPSDPVHIDDGLNLNDMNKWNRLFNEIQPKCNNLDV